MYRNVGVVGLLFVSKVLLVVVFINAIVNVQSGPKTNHCLNKKIFTALFLQHL